MKPVIAVVGPTAAGKSDLAIALATRLGGEVVNADSMQLYVGMDIGTAKLSESERGGVPHHLLDIWPVTRTATLAEYQQLALAEVDGLRAREVYPVVVGGSGMYIHAVVDRWHIPSTDPEVRRELEDELARTSAQAMHERLATLDPAAAVTILASDGRRIVRALEVVRLEGSFNAQLPGREETAGRVLIGLDVPREVLGERIEQRVERMWEAGLVSEVKALVEAGLRDGLTASRALGYSQVLRFLDGDCTEADARQETVRATRRFARRQDSWFRRDARVVWLPFDAADLVERAVGVTVGAG